MLTTFSHKFENEGVFVFEMQGYEIMVVVRRKQCEQKVYSLTQENMNKLGITNKKKRGQQHKIHPSLFRDCCIYTGMVFKQNREKVRIGSPLN